MTASEYADLVLQTTADLAAKIRMALPTDCQLETRYIQTGVQSEDDWLATLASDNGSIRMCVLLMTALNGSDAAQIAGAKNFQLQIRFGLELFHDYKFGTDAANTETVFRGDALRLQYAIEAGRSLPPKAKIEKYNLSLGIRPSKVRALHYGRGEIILNFREIRYGD